MALPRHDPANTAANPAASASVSPSVAWRRSVTGVTSEKALVVGRGAVYASGAGRDGGIAAPDRPDGTVRWREDELGVGDVVALR